MIILVIKQDQNRLKRGHSDQRKYVFVWRALLAIPARFASLAAALLSVADLPRYLRRYSEFFYGTILPPEVPLARLRHAEPPPPQYSLRQCGRLRRPRYLQLFYGTCDASHVQQVCYTQALRTTQHDFWSATQRGADYAKGLETCRCVYKGGMVIRTGSGTGSVHLPVRFAFGTRNFRKYN